MYRWSWTFLFFFLGGRGWGERECGCVYVSVFVSYYHDGNSPFSNFSHCWRLSLSSDSKYRSKWHFISIFNYFFKYRDWATSILSFLFHAFSLVSEQSQRFKIFLSHVYLCISHMHCHVHCMCQVLVNV